MTKTLEVLTLAEEGLVKLCNAADTNTLDRNMLRTAVSKGDKAIAAIREAKAKLEKQGSEHVAWLRYKSDPTGNKPPRIKLCDSDDPGAFKVFRHAVSVQPVKE